MVETLLHVDKNLFFFLNGLHVDWLDPVMYWISDKKIWIPFYAILLWWIVRTYGLRSIIYLVTIGIIITITDQIISGFMKGYFQRFRPSRDPLLEGLVHIVNDYKGGKYGFASSHSGNAFALAMFIYQLFKEYRWVWLMFLWAGIVAYSRVYLGVHYPGDILVGGVIGLLVAFILFKIANRLIKKYLMSDGY